MFSVFISMFDYEILFISVFVFVLGAIIGSFLNVLALRYNTGRSIRGRSACPSCLHSLTWFELIPIFSFLALKGRCRICKSKLSFQYPVVEFLTGILFVLIFFKSASVLSFLFIAFLTCIFITIGIYDIRHTIVPNGLSFSVGLLAFLGLFIDFNSISFVVPTFSAFFAGPIVALPLFLLWLVSGGKWMGLGDAKLTLSIGWILGLQGGLAALLIAFWAGALYGVGIIFFSYVWRKLMTHSTWTNRLFISRIRHTMSSEIPFAPFLLLGLTVGFFFEVDIIKLILWNI